MSNREKYNRSFMESLSVDEARLNGDLAYNTIPEWDSIAHMALIASLEEAFQISLDTSDIVDFSSYNKGCEILKKYGIEIS